MNKKEIAIELLRRRRARSFLHDFIVYMNPDYITSDFSRKTCSALDQFLKDMREEKRPILVLGAPPQHGKSDIVSRYLPAFFLGNNPDLRVAGLSYGKDLATDMNRDVQKIMLSDRYHVLFPGSTLNKKRVVTIEVEAKRNSDTFEIQGKKGSYIAQGVGGALTGKKVDLGIIDDPIKNAKEALSKTVKDGIWKWYVSTFLTRLSKNSGQIVMATRWAKDDLSGTILKKTKRAVNLAFKAISDTGKALVPDLHPIEKLLETKELFTEYFWSAMYQQEPITAGGGIFKLKWWKYYTELPPFRRKIITADTAMKEKEENDYSVFQCWGEGYDGNIYLIDQIRGKWEAPDLEANAISFYNKHRNANGCFCSGFYVEDKASGTGLIQSVSRKGIPIIPIPRDGSTGGKLPRMHSGAPSIKAGLVYIPENAEYTCDYKTEFSEAPRGKNDDQIDPTLDAIQILKGGILEDRESILDSEMLDESDFF